jgi:serine phosphatase RsbU (regulator of sigma subunit)
VTEGGIRRTTDAGDPLAAAVREILAAVPAGCTWLVPITGEDGVVVDFRVAAASGSGRDIYGRGVTRVGARLTELYPGMVDDPLWQVYLGVLDTGEPGHLPQYGYVENRAGVVADSVFDVTVHRAAGGLLVSWQRIDEDRRRLARTELLGRLGWAEYDLTTGRSEWSPGMYRIFDRDPALGPMSQAEQRAAVLPDDHGVRETAWQTLDSGAASDVTVRFRTGGSVKYLRILSDVARDAGGAPLKIYAVAQDITATQDSRTEIEQLSDQLRRREMTALAEHRLAGQLQSLIQPVPSDPVVLADLQVMVSYLPAESATRVGGDWYHAQVLPDGQIILAVGDVAGHGLQAATGMAHLRFALVGWLSIGVHDPGVLLSHLNRLSGQLKITGTALVAVYEPESRTLRWGRAGHMPPLLSRAGAAESLPRLPGLLLGAEDDAAYPVAVDRLHGDDLLLFYTDGLIERRDGHPGDQLAEVGRMLSAASVATGRRPLAQLARRLRVASVDDDICTLLVRVMP